MILGRLLLVALTVIDALRRLRASRVPVPEPAPPLVASTSPRPVEAPVAPRVLGHVLACPGVGALASVAVAIPSCGRDGAGLVYVAWLARVPDRADDMLVMPSAETAQRLLWSIRWAVPATTGIVPVVVEA